MKYKVTIVQRIKYADEIEGIFDSLAEVQQFIETIMAHFEKMSVKIDVIMDESEKESEESEGAEE